MTKENKQQVVEMQKPLASALPAPKVLWQGSIPYLGEQIPCRVVLAYEWSKQSDHSSWEVKPIYVYETARLTDYMRVPRYETAPLTELPGAFFADVMTAFTTCT